MKLDQLFGPAIVSSLVLVGAATLPLRAWQQKPKVDELEAWIKKLGHDNAKIREEASLHLAERENADAALTSALKSPDLEVARRAALVLKERARRKESWLLQPLTKATEKGKWDLAVETLVRTPTWHHEDAVWNVMTELAGKVRQSAAKDLGGKVIPPEHDRLPIGSFPTYFDKASPTLFASLATDPHPKTTFVARALEIRVKGPIFESLLVSAGKVQGLGDWFLVNCVVFAGGDVQLGIAKNCLIVCDGDLTIDCLAANCLMICRGNVKIQRYAEVGGCHIVTSAEAILGKQVFPNRVKEKQAVPLGWLTFFDPSHVGVTVEADKAGVRIKKADDGKPFAKAGLRAGDVILSLDGKAAESPEIFRRLLRAKVALGEETVVRVRRGDKTLDISVNLDK